MMDTRPGTESIALRAFAALECVVRASAPLALDEITDRLGLPKPTVFRILNLLKEAGLLHRDAATKRFSAGTRLTAFAVDLWRNTSLRSHWHRALEEAVAEIGETCNLTLLEGDRALYIDRVETSHPLRLHLETGTRVPLYCTSSGKLFLSQMRPEEVRTLLGDEPYKRFTPRTLTTYKELEAELERTRRTGVGLHDSELFADSVAVAVPIADPSGRIFAAVAMHAPSSRMNIEQASLTTPALYRAAAKIAATMGSDPRGAQVPMPARAAAVEPPGGEPTGAAAAAPAQAAGRSRHAPSAAHDPNSGSNP